MFKNLKLLINNDRFIRSDFIAMAKDTPDEHELAQHFKSWFVDALEFEKIEIVAKYVSRDNARSYEMMFSSILSAAIHNMPEGEWLELARYYLEKAKEV